VVVASVAAEVVQVLVAFLGVGLSLNLLALLVQVVVAILVMVTSLQVVGEVTHLPHQPLAEQVLVVIHRVEAMV
jgi:hypothetical protein